MACRMFRAKPLPEPMLSYCQMVTVTRNTFQQSSNRNSNIFIDENAFENVACKMAIVWLLPWYANSERIPFIKVSRFRRLIFIMGILATRKTSLKLTHPPSLKKNGRHFAEDILKRTSMNEEFGILFRISLTFVAKGLINSKAALVQEMAWRQAITWTNIDLVLWCIYAALGEMS